MLRNFFKIIQIIANTSFIFFRTRISQITLIFFIGQIRDIRVRYYKYFEGYLSSYLQLFCEVDSFPLKSEGYSKPKAERGVLNGHSGVRWPLSIENGAESRHRPRKRQRTSNGKSFRVCLLSSQANGKQPNETQPRAFFSPLLCRDKEMEALQVATCDIITLNN